MSLSMISKLQFQARGIRTLTVYDLDGRSVTEGKKSSVAKVRESFFVLRANYQKVSRVVFSNFPKTETGDAEMKWAARGWL